MASQRLYLISSLGSLARHKSASASLCSAHIRLLIAPTNPVAPSPTKVLKFVRKYTDDIPASAEVWLARLDAEKRFASREDVEQAWSDARNSVKGTSGDLEKVWVWGLDQYSSDGTEDRQRIYEARYSPCFLVALSSLNDHDQLIFSPTETVAREHARLFKE